MNTTFDEQTPEYLEALENVVKLCLWNDPCGRHGCRRCRKDVEEAWQREIELADQDAMLKVLFRGSL